MSNILLSCAGAKGKRLGLKDFFTADSYFQTQGFVLYVTGYKKSNRFFGKQVKRHGFFFCREFSPYPSKALALITRPFDAKITA